MYWTVNAVPFIPEGHAGNQLMEMAFNYGVIYFTCVIVIYI